MRSIHPNDSGIIPRREFAASARIQAALSSKENAMPAGANPKREREYEKLKKQFKTEGRYRGREPEVASRIVNKQRAQYGETETQKARAKAGQAPDRGLPVDGYAQMTIAGLRSAVEGLSAAQLRKLERYERAHKNRKGALDLLRTGLH
jgi:hypothetical protein